jgi:hypothetical protein
VRVQGPGLSEPLVRQVAYESGARLRVPDVPLGADRVITIEGLDADGLVVSRGESEAFALSQDEPVKVSIDLGRCTILRYPDADGDMFGDNSAPKTLCEPIEGFIEAGGDCNDQQTTVNPAQQAYFDSPIAGTQSYDYDCDGRETLQYRSTADCASAGPANCRDLVGWIDEIPECGARGRWVTCSKVQADCEAIRTEARTQACR